MAPELLYVIAKELPMSATAQELKDRATTDFEAGKKAFHDAMTKAQSQIDVANAEVNKLRTDLKTQSDEVKSKTLARVDELTKNLETARREQQAEIEARLKELHKDIESTNADLKHATAEGKTAAEATAKALRQEYDSARHVLTASLDGELAELKALIGMAADVAAGKKAAATASVQAKLADLRAKHEAAQKKLHALKQANVAAFGELHRGVRSAIGEVTAALQRARKDIAGA
jgi:predicted  nucleic acid-binding Zn-ribbon protein